MSGAGLDPSQRAEILLRRGDELLASGAAESLDEAVLAYEGALEATSGAEGEELRSAIEGRLRDTRERLEGKPPEREGGGEAAGEPEQADPQPE